MKIAGLWSGHDSSFCVLEDGVPIVHAELERYNRVKCTHGDAIQLMFDRFPDWRQIHSIATSMSVKRLQKHSKTYQRLSEVVTQNGGNVYVFSHHHTHAANAFYSSNLEDAVILTIDGGGFETEEGIQSACTIWYGKDNKLDRLHTFDMSSVNIGGVWSRITRYVFGLQNGPPHGGEEGTIMAMAAFGDPEKYVGDFLKMLTDDIIPSSIRPPGQPDGPTTGKDPKHPYLYKWTEIAQRSEQDTFDLAAGLQLATERLLKELIKIVMQSSPAKTKNLCIAGGVALNSVATGKIKTWFPEIENVYIPPVPYDGGISIGAAQIVYHNVFNNPRITWRHNFTPYLGERWTKEHIESVLTSGLIIGRDVVVERDVSINDVVDLLDQGKIVAVFNEGSESGRRALGNRSILADPRRQDIKNTLNLKVKHRKWFRPFAPSVLESEARNWFENYQESPYMQFVLPFKQEKISLVPGVVHKDGSARLQTVREEDNKWYYDLLNAWNAKTGVPILLNTSFNDREPICENFSDSLKCFLGTNIDCLYVAEHKILLKRL